MRISGRSRASLDYALAALAITGDGLRERLMDGIPLTIGRPIPTRAPRSRRAQRQAPRSLSNGSPRMQQQT